MSRAEGPPMLVLAAHGSRNPAARDVAFAVAEQLAGLAGVESRASFISHAAPSVADAVALAASRAGPRGVVVVPLLLTGGYHIAADLRPAAAAAGARVAAPLGPDPLLADALVDRLTEAGAPEGTPVVLASAGSSDPTAAADTLRQAALLGQRWGAPVRAAFASVDAPSVTRAASELAGRGRRPVAVASYLLAPGVFHDRLRRSGAAWVTEPLGGHPAVARIAAHRFHAAGGHGAPGPAPGPGQRASFIPSWLAVKPSRV